MKLRVLLVLLAAAATSQAQTRNVVEVQPPLKVVKLYLNNVELEHQGSVTLPAGVSRVLIRNASNFLSSANAVEVRLGDGVEVLAVGDDVDDEDTDKTAPGLTPANRAAADSLSRTNDELARLDAELKAIEEEKALLLANKVLPSGTQANWSTELQKGAALLRTRLVALQLETRQLTQRQEQQKRLAQGQERRSRPAEQIKPYLMTVRTPRAGTYPLTLRYEMLRRGAWRPKLEIRADESGKAVQFVSGARVTNRTGLDWNKVRLILINQVQEADLSKPELTPWTLDSDGKDDHIGEGRVDAFIVKGTAAGKPVEASRGTQYEVPEPVTLAFRENRYISMPALTLGSRTEYLSLPKLSDKVFLQAKVSGWEGLHLPDEADVYYRGAYVGTTDLEDRAYNDSLELSLGFDDRIIVGRSKLEDFSRNVGSKNRRVRLTYELNVRNLHPEAVRVKVQDQVPVSSEKEIEVKVLETSGAQLDSGSGRLTWYVNLPPNANQRIRFSFEVEFPRDKEVNIINHEMRISNPKFR